MRSLSRQDVVYLTITAMLVVAYLVAVLVFNVSPSPWDWD